MAAAATAPVATAPVTSTGIPKYHEAPAEPKMTTDEPSTKPAAAAGDDDDDDDDDIITRVNKAQESPEDGKYFDNNQL